MEHHGLTNGFLGGPFAPDETGLSPMSSKSEWSSVDRVRHHPLFQNTGILANGISQQPAR